MKANSRNNTLQDTGHFRAQARHVLQGTRLIESILNPEEFETAAQSVFQYSSNASQIRGRFVIQEEVYATMWPDENTCPLEMRQIAEEEIQRPIHSKLKAVIATPRSLLGCKTSKFARLAIRFPGGGGVSDYGVSLTFTQMLILCRSLENRTFYHGSIVPTSSTQRGER